MATHRVLLDNWPALILVADDKVGSFVTVESRNFVKMGAPASLAAQRRTKKLELAHPRNSLLQQESKDQLRMKRGFGRSNSAEPGLYFPVSFYFT